MPKVNIRRGHERALKASGLKMRIHDLRHAFITFLLQAGRDPAAVSALAGHGSLKITMEIYHHLHPEHAREVISAFPIVVTKNVSGIKPVSQTKKVSNGDPVND